MLFLVCNTSCSCPNQCGFNFQKKYKIVVVNTSNNERHNQFCYHKLSVTFNNLAKVFVKMQKPKAKYLTGMFRLTKPWG